MEPPKKTTFPPEFLKIIFTSYIYTNHNHIFGKNVKYLYRFFAAIFASFRFRRKFEKNTLPKEFFSEIWLILEDHEYINIAEIKLE